MIEKIEDVWRARQLLFISRIARMDDEKRPPIFITSAADGK